MIGAFNDGGSQFGRSYDTQNTFELQNYTTTVKGAHVWKYGVRLRGYLEDNVSPNDFNGTFIFSSIESYQQTLLGMPGADRRSSPSTPASPGWRCIKRIWERSLATTGE